MSNPTILSKLLGDNDGRMSLHQCERVAKDLVRDGVDATTITFEFVGNKGRLPCRWIDPHLGFFKLGDSNGFTRVCDVERYHGLHIENISVDEPEEKTDA